LLFDNGVSQNGDSEIPIEKNFCTFAVVESSVMAKPIKETPVLVGKDAKTFVAQMKAADKVRVSQQERARIRENFAKLQAIAKF
jgi:hypothetical protein